MRRVLAFLCSTMLMCLLAAGAACAEAEADNTMTYQSFTYGTSELGRPLECYAIGQEDADKSMLLIFGVHGFEDDFDHDAEILKMIAEEVIRHYADAPESLMDFRLYIVPTANPDGLIEGTTKDGFGRCNAKGLDINRDFPVSWKKRTDSRNKTGAAPFSTAEARAIRDLVEQVKPTYAMDIHGWIEASYGTGKMADVFAKAFGFGVKIPKSGGMLCLWLGTVTEEAIMIELPYNPDKEQYVQKNSGNLIKGIDKWIELKSDMNKTK